MHRIRSITSGADVRTDRRFVRPVRDDDPDWPEYRRAVGDRLREARVLAGLTQEGLAECAGVSRSLVQRTERAYGEVPSMEAVWRLGRACGAAVGELLRETGPVRPA